MTAGQPMVSLVYCIRDREPASRISDSISSIKKNTSISFEAVVVDYGSKLEFSKRAREACDKVGARYLRLETQGWPWNKSHGLNYGVSESTGKYIVTLDVDMIFEGDILARSLEEYKYPMSIHCRPLWLPPSGKRDQAVLGDYAQVGGYMFLDRRTYDEYGGYDERIKFWGLEDTEWFERLVRSGFKIHWIDDDIKMYHVWHPLSYGTFDTKPESAKIDSWKATMSNILGYEIPAKQGACINYDNRPILKYIENSTPFQLSIQYFLNDLNNLKLHIQEKFISVELGERVKYSKNSWITGLMKKPRIRAYLLANGLDLVLNKNPNFDQFYASLEMLKELGLRDYYILEDLSRVYLLFD